MDDQVQVARETLSSVKERAYGMFFTPERIAERIVASAVSFSSGSLEKVLDLSAGEGSFLSAAYSKIDGPVRAVGIEIDPLNAKRCQEVLDRRAERGRQGRIVVANGLDPAIATSLAAEYGSFDLVVGNPPFLSPRLRSDRFRDLNAVNWDWLKNVFPMLAGPTTDLSAYFFVRGFQLLRPGGVIAMVMPASFVSAQGSEEVRRLVSAEGTVLAIERLEAGAFEANVNAVAVIASRGEGRPDRRGDWGRFLAESPSLDIEAKLRVGDVARVTAGFRDEYYEVAARVRESSGLPGESKVITVGLTGFGRHAWGFRQARIARRSYSKPVVDTVSGPALRATLKSLVGPKILIPPQKLVVSPVVDEIGDLMPLTPLISVLPAELPDGQVADRLHLLASALASPVASALTEHGCAGTGLSKDALKFSARWIAEIPLPILDEDWRRSARLLQLGVASGFEGDSLRSYMEAVLDAYQITGGTRRQLAGWWLPRASRQLQWSP